MEGKALKIHAGDNVAVALSALPKGTVFEGVTLREEIPQGHKFALRDLQKGENITKYGFPIGSATEDIPAGGWVHTHNVFTNLRENDEYVYTPEIPEVIPVPPESFPGFLRPDGRVGIRNEIWILPLVGCVNDVAEALARRNAHRAENSSIDGVYAFPHPYGCSQMSEDLENTWKLLAALTKHPNAGGVLVLGLGCEDIVPRLFRESLGDFDERRVKFLVCQEAGDEIAAGDALLAEIAEYAASFQREPVPVSKLVVGMKCGGSDGMSGITANPVVGSFCDMLVARGASVLLTEVPEMFGAEEMLLRRAESEAVFGQIGDMIQRFKAYFVAHGQIVYDNPSPGNKDGGITTLEDKSLGCVQKGGHAPVVDVLDYAEGVRKPGLSLLYGPGNDLVSSTALTASGAQIIFFTTGRGTPFSAPVPTVKIATNTPLFEKKRGWLDFNAGTVAQGTESIDQAARRLFAETLDIVSDRTLTRAEAQGYRGMAIWRGGVTV